MSSICDFKKHLKHPRLVWEIGCVWWLLFCVRYVYAHNIAIWCPIIRHFGCPLGDYIIYILYIKYIIHMKVKFQGTSYLIVILRIQIPQVPYTSGLTRKRMNLLQLAALTSKENMLESIYCETSHATWDNRPVFSISWVPHTLDARFELIWIDLEAKPHQTPRF